MIAAIDRVRMHLNAVVLVKRERIEELERRLIHERAVLKDAEEQLAAFDEVLS